MLKLLTYIFPLIILCSAGFYFDFSKIIYISQLITNILFFPVLIYIIIYVVTIKSKKTIKFKIKIIDSFLELKFWELCISLILSYLIYTSKIFGIYFLLYICMVLINLIIFTVDLYIFKKDYISCDYSEYIGFYTPLKKMIWYSIAKAARFHAFVILYIVKNKDQLKHKSLKEAIINVLISRTFLPIIILKTGISLTKCASNVYNSVDWSKKRKLYWINIWIYCYIREYRQVFRDNHELILYLKDYKIYRTKTNGSPLTKELQDPSWQIKGLRKNGILHPYYFHTVNSDCKKETIGTIMTHNGNLSNIFYTIKGKDNRFQFCRITHESIEKLEKIRLDKYYTNNEIFTTQTHRLHYLQIFTAKALFLDYKQYEYLNLKIFNESSFSDILAHIKNNCVLALIKKNPNWSEKKCLEEYQSHFANMATLNNPISRAIYIKSNFQGIDGFDSIETYIDNILNQNNNNPLL